MRGPKPRAADDHSAYHVPERTQAQARSVLRCVRCDDTVEAAARPADTRVAALCDKCQRETMSR